MERLNAYTVTIHLEPMVTSFIKTFLNGEDNKACNNIAIKQGIEFLETLPEEQEIGIWIIRQEMLKSFSGNKYIGGKVYITYSHICNDKSNWVTVKEAKNFLKSM